MGNRRKSKVNRLPKAERTNTSSKIVVLSPDQLDNGATSSPITPGSSSAQDAQMTLHETDFPAIAASHTHAPSASNRPAPSPRNSPQGPPANLSATDGFPADIDSDAAMTSTAVLPTLPPPPLSAGKRRKLDDESLRKILRAAGLQATIAALQVCVQWRNVAKELIGDTKLLDLSKLYVQRNTRATPPSMRKVIADVERFTSIETLVVRDWPYEDVLEDVALRIAADCVAPTLREVEFSGVLVTGAGIIDLMSNVSRMEVLKLGGHDSVNNSVLRALYRATCRQRNEHGAGFVLQRLHLTKARRVTDNGVCYVLGTDAAKSVYISKCPGLRDIQFSQSLRGDPSQPDPTTSMNVVDFNGCSNLSRYAVIKHPTCGDMFELNLSQCTKLVSVSFDVHHDNLQTTDVRYDIRRLNLSGCRALVSLYVDQPPVRVLFPDLEELVLFGAHRLARWCIEEAFGLDKEDPILPKLRRLDVNGTLIDKLVLVGYQFLTTVDCSGCGCLDTLTVRDCWKLERLLVLGRRARLRHVNLMLPRNCRLEGKRDRWQWHAAGSIQTASFP